MIDIVFVTGSNNPEILKNNLLRSPIIREGAPVHTIPNPKNLPAAYNFLTLTREVKRAALKCYVHHDVYLPPAWDVAVERALDHLGDDWGVLGVAGACYGHQSRNGRRRHFGWIRDRGKEWGSPSFLPREVETLDEMLLITRGDIHFDESFPFDFYGADICLQAREKKRKVYVIAAYCEHNSLRRNGERTPAFYTAQARFRDKWRHFLPIATTCSLIEK